MRLKTKKVWTFLFSLVIFMTFSAVTVSQETGSEEVQKQMAFKTAYPNTTKDYRGVVSIDANGGCADELYCDFGSNGLWVYQAMPTPAKWVKLNAADPDWIIGFQHGGLEYLLCDFGAAGLWYWQYNLALPGQFVKISSANPDFAFVADDDWDGDDEVFISFGANGLWRYDKGATPILTKLHATSPNMAVQSLRSDLWIPGHEEGTFDFSGNGIWSVWQSGGVPVWQKINANSANDDNVSAECGIGDAAEELIMDFSTSGMWLYDGTNWHKLIGNDPYDVVAAKLPSTADYELICYFYSLTGLWMWDYTTFPGLWTKISNSSPDWDGGFCEPFDPNSDSWEEVAVDFASNGLWLYDHAASTKWTKLNSSDPEFMIKSNLYCTSLDSALVVDFGTAGLWIYSGGGWTQITTFSPDGVL